MNEFISKKHLKQIQKFSRSFSIVFVIVMLIIMIGIPAFQWLIDFIWMDTLGFGSVYTTILTSKLILALSGFILFFLTIFATLFWVRKTYLRSEERRVGKDGIFWSVRSSFI